MGKIRRRGGEETCKDIATLVDQGEDLEAGTDDAQVFVYSETPLDSSLNGREDLSAHLSRYQRRAMCISFLIFVTGAVASLAFFCTGWQSSKNSSMSRFTKASDEVTIQIRHTWQEFSLTSLWMHEACRGDNYRHSYLPTPAASIGCTYQDYLKFWNYITASRLPFEAVYWASNVSHEERPALEAQSREYINSENYKGISEARLDSTGNFAPFPRSNQSWYFVQHYLLPFDPAVSLFLDSDVHASPTLWPIIQSSLDNMLPRVSSRLRKRDQLSYYVQLYNPGIAQREDPSLNGVAVVMVRIFDILQRSLQSKQDPLNVYLYDYVPQTLNTTVNASYDPAFFLSGAFNGANQARILPEISLGRAREASSRHLENLISIEDRTWLVLVTDPQGSYDPDYLVPVVGGVLIFVAVTALSIWFYCSTKRVARLQRISVVAQAEKAALLAKVNQELNQQVEQRVNELRQTEFLANQKAREAEQAEARSESMVQTMSMLSHELRTPLQGIMGITSMILSECVFEDSNYPCEGKPEDFLTKRTSYSKQSSITTSTDGVTLSTNSGVSSKTPSESRGTVMPRERQDDESGTASTNTTLTCSRDKIQENMYTIQASSQLLLTLINNLLDVRKISAGVIESFELVCVDLLPIIKQCLCTVRPLSTLSDVKINVTCDLETESPQWFAKGDVLRIQQVLINLVGNAIKYSSMSLASSGEATSLDVSMRRTTLAKAQQEALGSLCCADASIVESLMNDINSVEGQKEVIIVDVRDRGNGIPEDEAEKVFAAFKMLKQHSGTGNTKMFAQPTGSGLGLQLCGNMINMMGGCIWANNCDSPMAAGALSQSQSHSSLRATNDLDGCIFSFYLECPSESEVESYLMGLQQEYQVHGFPSSETNQQDDTKVDCDEHIQESAPFHNFRIPADLKSVKVLVVDDFIVNLKVLSRMLEAVGFVNVRSATSGRQALEMLQHDGNCDLILTDYQMPGMNGMELAAEVRKIYSKHVLKSPFLVLCTADYSPAVQTSCQQAGIQSMLRKPVTLKDLSMFIQNHQSSV